MEIKINGRDVEIQGNSISFDNEELGMRQRVVPKSLTYDLEAKMVSVNAVARNLSPTGVEVSETGLGMVNIKFHAKEFESKEFKAKYVNGIFRTVMERFGMAVYQVMNEESGEVEVILETPPIDPMYPKWEQPGGEHDAWNSEMRGNKVSHNGKNWETEVENNVKEPGMPGAEWIEI